MGRTNPTYRRWLQQFEEHYQSFRRALRADDQPAFDQVFEQGHQHADAAGYLNSTDPEIAFLISVLVAQERRLQALEATEDRPPGEGDSDTPPSSAGR
jgi:hypothetical protein